MNSEPRRKFDPDFKRNAVLLCAEPGRSVAEVAKNLGIGQDLLYRWRREYPRANGQYVFPAMVLKYCPPDQKRIRELEKKLRDTEMERDILKKFVATTDSRHNEPVAPNLLNRGFDVKVPNTVWVTDITYLKIGRQWYYLTVFIDLFSRCVVGWDLSGSLERHSVIRALNKAIIRRRPGRGLMIHSDRGVQYASQDFKKVLKKHSFIQSMSRKGNCWDTQLQNPFSIH